MEFVEHVYTVHVRTKPGERSGARSLRSLSGSIFGDENTKARSQGAGLEEFVSRILLVDIASLGSRGLEYGILKSVPSNSSMGYP